MKRVLELSRLLGANISIQFLVPSLLFPRIKKIAMLPVWTQMKAVRRSDQFAVQLTLEHSKTLAIVWSKKSINHTPIFQIPSISPGSLTTSLS